MTTQATESERAEHAHLREHVEHMRLAARELPALSSEERAEIVSRILSFLRGTLLPHAAEEERSLARPQAT